MPTTDLAPSGIPLFFQKIYPTGKTDQVGTCGLTGSSVTAAMSDDDTATYLSFAPASGATVETRLAFDPSQFSVPTGHNIYIVGWGCSSAMVSWVDDVWTAFIQCSADGDAAYAANTVVGGTNTQNNSRWWEAGTIIHYDAAADYFADTPVIDDIEAYLGTVSFDVQINYVSNTMGGDGASFRLYDFYMWIATSPIPALRPNHGGGTGTNLGYEWTSGSIGSSEGQWQSVNPYSGLYGVPGMGTVPAFWQQTPSNLRDESDATGYTINTQEEGTKGGGRLENTPSDFVELTAAPQQRLRYSGFNTVALTVTMAIFAEDGTVLAAADSSGTPVVAINNVTENGTIKNADFTYPYYLTTATKAQWDSAILYITHVHSATDLNRSVNFREVYVTLTYSDEVTELAEPDTILGTVTLPAPNVSASGGDQTAQPAVISRSVTLPVVTIGGDALAVHPFQLTGEDSRSVGQIVTTLKTATADGTTIGTPSVVGESNAWEAVDDSSTSSYVQMADTEGQWYEMPDMGIASDESVFQMRVGWTSVFINNADDTFYGYLEFYDVEDGEQYGYVWHRPFVPTGSYVGSFQSDFYEVHIQGYPAAADWNDMTVRQRADLISISNATNPGDDGTEWRSAYWYVSHQHTFKTALPIQFLRYNVAEWDSDNVDIASEWGWDGTSNGNIDVRNLHVAGGSDYVGHLNDFAYVASGVEQSLVHAFRMNQPLPVDFAYGLFARISIECDGNVASAVDFTHDIVCGFKVTTEDGTVLAAADASGAWQESIEFTTVGYQSDDIDFAYVNQTATRADWHDAWLHIRYRGAADGSGSLFCRPGIRYLLFTLTEGNPDATTTPATILATAYPQAAAASGSSGTEQRNPDTILATATPLAPIVSGSALTTPATIGALIVVFPLDVIGTVNVNVDVILADVDMLAPNVSTQQDGNAFAWFLEPYITINAPTLSFGYEAATTTILAPVTLAAATARAGATRAPASMALAVSMDAATFVVEYTARPSAIPATVTMPPIVGSAGATASVGLLNALLAVFGPTATAQATATPLAALTTVSVPPVTASATVSATKVLETLLATVTLPSATTVAGVSKIIRPATALLLAQLDAVTRGGGATTGVGVIVLNTNVFSPSLFIAVTREPTTIAGVITLGLASPSAHASRIPGVIDADVVMPPTQQVDNVTATRVPDTIQVVATPRQTTQVDSISGQRNPAAIPALLTPLQVIPNQGAGKTAPFVSLSTLVLTPTTHDNVTATPQPGTIDLEALLGAPVISYGSSRVASAIQAVIGVNPADLSYGASREPGQITVTVSMGAVGTIAGTGSIVEPAVILGQFNLNAAAIHYGETKLLQRIATHVLMEAIETHSGGGRAPGTIHAVMTPLQVAVYYVPNIDQTVSVATIQATVAINVADVLVFVDATIEWIVTGRDGADWEGGVGAWTGYDSMNSMGEQPTFQGGSPGSFEGTS